MMKAKTNLNVSFTNHLFNECFGDLSKETQEKLKNTLNIVTTIINMELTRKPFINQYGEVKNIQLSKIDIGERKYKFINQNENF